LNFEDEVTQPLAPEYNDKHDEWKHNKTDGEKGDCNSSIELVIARAILKSNNIHSSECIKVYIHKLVSVDEHSDQHTQEQDVEDVNEESDE